MIKQIETPKEIQVTWRYQSTEYPIAAFKMKKGLYMLLLMNIPISLYLEK